MATQRHQLPQAYASIPAAVPADSLLYKNPAAQTLLMQFEAGEKTTFTRKEKRILRKELNHQLVVYAKAAATGNHEKQSNAALIILAVLAAIGLLMAVAMLACSLACSGAEAAAILVAILGTAGVIWGTVAIIRSASRKKVPAPVTTAANNAKSF